MNTIFLKSIEDRFEQTLLHYISQNPSKGTPFEGLFVLEVLGKVTDKYKEKYIENGLDEKIVNETLDFLYSKMRDKYTE